MYCQDQAIVVDRERLFDWHAVVPRKSSSSHSSHTSQTIGVPSIYSNASSTDASSIPRALSAASNSNSSSASSSQMNITTYPANEEEFAMLPPAIRRKQFSTVERLRLAQQSNCVPNEQKPRSLSAGSSQSKESGSLPRSPHSPHTPKSPLFPKSTGQSPSKSPKDSTERKMPFKASAASDSIVGKSLILTQSDARWFLQLGDTIKRKLFTPEERMILQSKCEDMIQNFERSNTPSNSCFSTAAFNDSLTTLASVDTTSKVDTMPVDLAPRPRRNYEPTTVSTAPIVTTIPVKTTTRRAIIRESFKWIEDDEHELETQLVLDSLKDINGNIQTTTVEVPDSRRNSRMSSVSRPSIKRTLSLTRCNSNRNSISKFTDSSDWSNNLRARRMSRRSTSQSISVPSSRRVSYAASTPSRRVSMEQDAAFWQDPDARLKLRLYLASAQNFDEALEFGFPSMQGDRKEANNISKQPAGEVYNTPKCVKSNISFLADDDEDEDDKDSIRSLKRGNTTRCGTRERLHVVKSSTVNSMASASTVSAVQVTPDVDLDCISTTPLQPRVVKPTFTESGVGGREMTLRMTLTRKDLRADESELYGWQGTNNASNGNNENVAPQTCPADFDFPWQADDRNGNKWIVSKIWSKVRHGHGAIPKRC